MAIDDMVDPVPDPEHGESAPPADPAVLLEELADLHGLAVTAEALARTLGAGAGRLDRTERSALEMARDNAASIVTSLDRVV